ncbi:MFS transporter [Paenibacillus rhizovicinus]|uniref:MFS transporter n=1 Tax=Paenibacillus rhizovicinus TaxID=2704463 RepID=A0A6C0NUP3_9BACL|nr:MFS transporter [Paenibacillus rhizovicinus]QHW29919.1 MFS transporter [Paenibacillus rhizovicinus]
MTTNPASGRSTDSIWKNRVFTRMFAAYAGAAMGEWFDGIAIQVLIVYRWGVGPVTLSWIPVAMALPGLLLGTFAGVAADRLPRIRLMLLSDLFTAAVTAAILLAPNIYALIPLLALRAGAAAFVPPAQQAMMRHIVPEDQLFRATTLNGMLQQGAKIAGPLAGAFVLAVLSPSACIVAHAAARLLSAGLLWTVRSAESGASPDREAEKRRSVAAEWREGLRTIVRVKPVLHTLLFGCVGLIAILMVDFQFATLLRELAPGRPSLLGWLIAAIGAGSVAVMLLLNKRKRASSRWGLGGGYVMLGAALAGLGLLSPGAPNAAVLALGLLLGIGNGACIATKTYLLQREMPAALIGRVFGVDQALTSFVMLGAPLTGGLLIAALGARPVFAMFGWATAAIGLVGMICAPALWGRSGEFGTGSARQKV